MAWAPDAGETAVANYLPNGTYLPSHVTSQVTMTDRLLAVLQRLAVGSVAITERAIAGAGADLTFVQWRVLLIVGERDEGVSIGEIASRIGANASPASRLISRLKRRGVVLTEKDDLDGRVTRVRLTEDGMALRSRVLDHRRVDLASVASAVALTRSQVEAIDQVAQALDSFG